MHTKKIADDWLAAHRHQVLLAETFCDPVLFPGTMYGAAGREGPGETAFTQKVAVTPPSTARICPVM